MSLNVVLFLLGYLTLTSKQDLISYKVKSLDPLKLEMCVEPTGK